jgi:hypothetical protein
LVLALSLAVTDGGGLQKVQVQARVTHKHSGQCPPRFTPAGGFKTPGGKTGCCVVGVILKLMEVIEAIEKCTVTEVWTGGKDCLYGNSTIVAER